MAADTRALGDLGSICARGIVSRSRLLMMEDRLAGILLGTAVGDALGLPAEGIRPARIKRLWRGPWRHRFFLGRGMLSDDSEHIFFVAQSLLESPADPRLFQRCLAKRLRWPSMPGCDTTATSARPSNRFSTAAAIPTPWGLSLEHWPAQAGARAVSRPSGLRESVTGHVRCRCCEKPATGSLVKSGKAVRLVQSPISGPLSCRETCFSWR